MSVRSLDSSGDWVFGTGKAAYLQNQLAVGQQIKCRLLSFFGNCFFDLAAGIDWFNLLGGKDLIALQVAISATILNTSNVTGIRQLSLVLNRTTRALTVSYEVQTVYSVLSSQLSLSLEVLP
jgi:hypothetical protein